MAKRIGHTQARRRIVANADITILHRRPKTLCNDGQDHLLSITIAQIPELQTHRSVLQSLRNKVFYRESATPLVQGALTFATAGWSAKQTAAVQRPIMTKADDLSLSDVTVPQLTTACAGAPTGLHISPNLPVYRGRTGFEGLLSLPPDATF